MTKFELTEKEKELNDALRLLTEADISVLLQKGRTYGNSWKRRGGVGAFMMLARKWDRIENLVQAYGYDVFAACEINIENILDDIADLRRYLLLVESHLHLETETLSAAIPENYEARNMDLFAARRIPVRESRDGVLIHRGNPRDDEAASQADHAASLKSQD